MTRTAIPSSFNEIHGTFVTTENGTTLSELVQVLSCVSITPLLIPLLIPWVVPPSFAKQAVYDKDFFFLIRAIVEYPVISVFPVWALTFFAGQNDDPESVVKSSGVVFTALFSAVIGILIINHAITAPRWLGFKTHWEKIKNMPTGWSPAEQDKDRKQGKMLFITNYRAIVIYITVLCILAVDFTVFPRRFSKTKTYGISLMDVGTGCFIFANGIVAPESRNKQSTLSTSIKSTVPLFIIGFIRLISVKGIEYQEVVEEYGVHWNFFFTLAGIKISSSILFMMFDSAHALKLSAVVCLVHEFILNWGDLQNSYIMNPKIPRDGNLISANREGVFSITGYLAIYLASIYFGRLIYWNIRVSILDWMRHTFRTFLRILVLWTLYAVSVTYGNLPCRRTANLSYVLLMVALNYSLLWFQLLIALIQVCFQHLGLIYGPIIFYELAELQRKDGERIRNLQQMKNRVLEAKRDGSTSNKSEDFDKQLQILEDKLEETLQQINKLNEIPTLSSDIYEKVMAIEREISILEGKLSKDDSDTDIDHSSTNQENKLVLMPDLSKSPIILEAITFNGLAVFLVGNLLTGLINCLIYTMYTPPYLSLCYLWFYSTVITAFSVTLYWYNFQIKFW